MFNVRPIGSVQRHLSIVVSINIGPQAGRPSSLICTHSQEPLMRHLSRRLFLHESLLAVGAAAALPSILQAADEPKQSKSPSERLSIAVLGVNGRGSDHIKAYNERTDCVISYICDVDTAVGNRVLKNFKGDKY